ncbi:MAG: hypothetical protein ACFB14_12530 [Leptolyngbyaceae cyanobacterium]
MSFILFNDVPCNSQFAAVPICPYGVGSSLQYLTGCSVDPYIIQGMFEQLIPQEDYISCFDFLDGALSEPIWNSDETALMVNVELTRYTYTFNLSPTVSSDASP